MQRTLCSFILNYWGANHAYIYTNKYITLSSLVHPQMLKCGGQIRLCMNDRVDGSALRHSQQPYWAHQHHLSCMAASLMWAFWWQWRRTVHGTDHSTTWVCSRKAETYPPFRSVLSSAQFSWQPTDCVNHKEIRSSFIPQILQNLFVLSGSQLFFLEFQAYC